MTSSETYLFEKSIGLWTSTQIEVKKSVSSSSPNFEDKCFIEQKCKELAINTCRIKCSVRMTLQNYAN